MTRVVPTQAVATIERLFPGSRNSTSQATYSMENANALRGIVDLIRQIPQELLILPADQYADLIISIGAMEQSLLMWASRDALKVIKPATVAATTLARDFRNLIHPGAAARRSEVCDRATALSALAGLEHVIRDLSS
jgi:hypothetical protein